MTASATAFRYEIENVYPATQSDTVHDAYVVYRRKLEGRVPRPQDLVVEGWAFSASERPTGGVVTVDGEVRGTLRILPEGFVAFVHTAGLEFGAHQARVHLRFGEREEVTDPVAFDVRPSVTLPLSRPHRLCLVHAPKVGGTFQEEILIQYMGIENPPYNHEWRWETMLDHADMIHPDFEGSYVTGGHMLPRWKNLSSIRRYGLTTVGGWRNIADAIVSIDDHVHNEQHIWPFFYIGRRDKYLALDEQERYRFLIRRAAPWYIDYYIAWRDVGVPILARYEWMAADQFTFFTHLIACIFGEVDEVRLRSVLAAPHENVRFNKGINGRAGAKFSETTKALLEATIRDHYQPLNELIEELPWHGGAEKSIALAMARREYERTARERWGGWSLPPYKT
jgi:hypothetical protein